jgi:hypothetical protein
MLGDVIYIPNHRAVAVSRLLAQYRNKPRIVALVRALASGAQALEDDVFGVLTSTTFTAATNTDLDHWGILVGEERAGLNDTDYRAMIGARILANRSRGTRDELIQILQIITAPSVVVLTDVFPACFQFVIRRATYMADNHARRVGRLMRSIKPAGVAMLLFEAADGYYGHDPDLEALPLDLGTLSRLI